MPTTTTTSKENSLVQNLPSQFQNELWGGILGAGSQLVWPGGNFQLPPEYQGQLTAGLSPAALQYLQQTGGLQGPDYSGLMGNANMFAQQASAGIRNPGDINFQTGYTPQNFQTPGMVMENPFAGYAGGQGMVVTAPQGIGATAGDYKYAVDQVRAPGALNWERIGGLPQVQGPQLERYQMGPGERVSGPGGLSSFQIAGPERVQAGAVGTQSFTQPGTAAQFMSPYTQNVLDAQKAAAQRDYDQQLTQIHADAARTGNFGGSRQAVMDATANRDLQNRMAEIEASGRQQAFQQAQQQFNAEQGLGLQGQQFNVQSGLQAALANQQAGQQAALANQQAALAAQGLGTQTGLQAALANQQAGLTVGGQNLQALLQTQGLGAQLGSQAQLANQQMAYQQQLANQQAGLQAGMFTNQQQLQAALANQQANAQMNQYATGLGFQGAQFNNQQNMQAQQLNQAMYENALQRQFGAMGQTLGANLQGALQTQNLGLQAQQLQSQANQFGAGLGLQAQTAQEQARNALQGQNLGYLNFMGGQNQQMGNWMTQGLQNNLAVNNAMAGAAGFQQNYDQQAADRAYQYWQQQNQFPYQQLDWLGNLAGKMPAQGSVQTGQTGTQSQTTPGPSFWNTVLGLAGTAAGAFTGGLGGGLGKGLVKRRGGLIAPARPRRPNYATGLGALARAA